MAAHRVHAIVALVLLASTTLLVPLLTGTAQAADSVGAFNTPQIVSGQSGENYAWVSAHGTSAGDIGIAFERATSGDTGFARGNSVTGFTVKTNDIDPTETSIKRPYVLRVDDNTWFIAAQQAVISGNEQYLYKSTNGGTTWTQIQLVTGTVFCYAPPTLAYDAVANVLLWTRCRTSVSGSELAVSTDLGASFVVRISRTYTTGNVNFPTVWAGVDGTNAAIYELWENEGIGASGGNRNHANLASSQDGTYWSTVTQKDSAGACGNSCTSNKAMVARGQGSSRAAAWDYCTATGCATQNSRYSNDGGNTWGALTGNVINPCQADARGSSYAYATTTGLYFSGSQATTPASVLGSFPTTNGIHCAVISAGRLHLVYSDQNANGQLKIQSAAITGAAPGAATPYASRDLTAERIKGADIDWDGRVLIVRTQTAGGSGVQQIRSLNTGTGTLSDKGTPYVLGCNAYHGAGTEREEGVFGYYDRNQGAEFTSFIDCTDTGNRDKGQTWRIRNGNLEHPSLGATSVCDQGDFCDDDVTSTTLGCDGGNTGLPDQTREFSDIQSVPVSFSRGSTGGVNHATVGFAFFDKLTGEIGVWAKTFTNGPDQQCKATRSFSAPSALYQLCTWTDGLDGTNTGNDYMAAVGLEALTKVLRIEVNTATLSAGSAVPVPQVTLTNIQAPSTPWDHGAALSCGGGTDGLIMSSTGHVNRLHLVGSQLGQPMWAADYVAPAVTQRGVAMANAGYLAAVYNGLAASTVTILNGTTGVVRDTIVLPTHTQLVGMQLDDTAQHLFVELNTATDGLVREYDVHALHHNGTSIPPGTRPGPGGTTVCLDTDGHAKNCSGTTTTTAGAASCGSSFCVDKNSASLPDGWTALAFNGFLGLLLIVGMIGVGVKHVGGSGVVVGIFTALALVIGNLLGFIPLWVINTLIVLSVAVFFLVPSRR